MGSARDGVIRIFLVDDHELIRRGFAGLLDSEEGFEVVGEASSRREALDLVAVTRPDVVVLDVQLPDGYGVSLCREIRERNERVRCLILTAFDDEGVLFDAIRAGASGYLLKTADGTELIEAVRTIGLGGSLFDPSMVERASRTT